MTTIYEVINYNLPVKARCKVTIIIAGKHGFANTGGAKPWRLWLKVNGSLMKDVSGSGVFTETPVLVAGFTVNSAQTLLLEVRWYGEDSMTLQAGTAMTAIVSYK